MHIQKNELVLAEEFIAKEMDRLIDWSVGDIARCCRMNSDGTCEDNGALVGAFILWTCAIDYFGGLYTGNSSPGGTKARVRGFIMRYMPIYDPEKIIDLRWSLVHYYTSKHFVFFHDGNLEKSRKKHLSKTGNSLFLHLGCSIVDLQGAVKAYREDLANNDDLKIKVWRYNLDQKQLMPLEFTEPIFSNVNASFATGATYHSFTASGTDSSVMPRVPIFSKPSPRKK